MCHEKEAKEFNRSEHGRIFVPSKNKEGQACETCHGPGSIHAEAEGKAGKMKTIINPGKDPEACYKCHLDKKAEFNLQYHHPVPEGRMTCTDCHDPHGEYGIKPGTRKSVRGKNELCFNCHKDKAGPFVYEHEAMREGCSTCHNVHGSINDKMVKERDTSLCLKCHFQTNFTPSGGIGNNAHSATRFQEMPCFTNGCHTAVHGSNYNDHLRV
ncbi:MAG: hypothetical protein HQL30_10365 [Candidatus Omnitrophica bacterium]|nr:hypothetical protein [Candidatus Omnitrophota bacterium]